MKYTNEHGLDPIVCAWLEADDYDRIEGVYSATQLMKAVRMVVLEKRHADELEIDISDLIASRYGTSLHDSFEKIDIPNAIQEERFFTELNGEKISGKPDIIQIDGKTFVIWDIKSTSVWTYIYKSREEDYRIQLSIYRWLAIKGKSENVLTNIPEKASTKGKTIYLFTDWSKSKAKQGGNYPPIRIVVEDIELMDEADTEQYILSRLELFNAHMDTLEPDLPACTEDELWTNYIIRKEGRKSDVKKFNNREEAAEFLANMDDKHYLQLKHNRCDYCVVTQFCSQYKQLLSENLVAE